jgi:hypothetical protein
MKHFSHTIHQLIGNTTFRQSLEKDMAQTLAKYELSLSASEQEALQVMLASISATAKTEQRIHRSLPGLPDFGWPLINLNPQETMA